MKKVVKMEQTKEITKNVIKEGTKEIKVTKAKTSNLKHVDLCKLQEQAEKINDLLTKCKIAHEIDNTGGFANIKMTVAEYLSLQYRNDIAKKYQRCYDTGSHDKKYRAKMLSDILSTDNGHDLGDVILNTDNFIEFDRVDGNSRFHSFIKMLKDNKDDKITLRKIKNSLINVKLYHGLNIEEQATIFFNKNNSEPMTGTQKHKGISEDNFTNIVNQLNNFVKNCNLFTEKQVIKDITVDIATQIICNLQNKYNSSAAKRAEVAQNYKANIDLQPILNLLKDNNFGKNPKYQLITEISLLLMSGTFNTLCHRFGMQKGYNKSGLYSVNDLLEIYKKDCVFIQYDTTGANSVIKNNDRFLKLIEKSITLCDMIFNRKEQSGDKNITTEQLEGILGEEQ